MKSIARRAYFELCVGLILGGSALLAASAVCEAEGPSQAADQEFRTYVTQLESRLAQQHKSGDTFLAHLVPSSDNDSRLRQGEMVIEHLTPEGYADQNGAMLHHWRDTLFVPGAKAADFERLVRNFNAYPRYFSPQVLRTQVLQNQGDRQQVLMRVRQKHVITVVMDTTYDITFGRFDRQHGYCYSLSAKISEIKAPGTSAERTLSVDEEHGFLWHTNTYWSYEERDGGLYLQIESVSLTRAIPAGLGWAIQPFVESVPRESLEFTLRAVRDALKSQSDRGTGL